MKTETYNEALKRARDVLNNEEISDDTIACLQSIFPELKEPEDEVIIRTLIGMFSSNCKKDWWGIPTEKIIALLEKQKESDETKAKMFLIDKGYPVDTNGTFPTYEEMYNIIRSGIEKENEQTTPQTNERAWLHLVSKVQEHVKKLYGEYEIKTYNPIEQKPADKGKPKFHNGELIVHQGTGNIYTVVAVIDDQYQLRYGDNYTVQKCADVDKYARLLNTAKDVVKNPFEW